MVRLILLALLLVPQALVASPQQGSDGVAEFIKTHSGFPCYLTPCPPYPLVSRAHREQGKIVVQVTFAKAGQVTAVKLLDSSGYANLDGNTIRYIKAHWRSTYRQEKTMTVPLVYALL